MLKIEDFVHCVREHQEIHKRCYNIRVKNISYFIYFQNKGLLRNMVGKIFGDVRDHAKIAFETIKGTKMDIMCVKNVNVFID